MVLKAEAAAQAEPVEPAPMSKASRPRRKRNRAASKQAEQNHSRYLGAVLRHGVDLPAKVRQRMRNSNCSIHIDELAEIIGMSPSRIQAAAASSGGRVQVRDGEVQATRIELSFLEGRC